MEIRERKSGNRIVVELSGRLTVNDKPGVLRDAITGALRDGAKDVLLDLSGVRYIDSTRLGELISAHISVSRSGGRLKLIGTPTTILELLEIAGLQGIFERHETVEDAIKN